MLLITNILAINNLFVFTIALVIVLVLVLIVFYNRKLMKKQREESTYEIGQLKLQCDSHKDELERVLQARDATITELKQQLSELSISGSEQTLYFENLRNETENKYLWLKQVINSVDIGIVVVDAENHRIIDANKKMLDILGQSLNALQSKLCSQITGEAETEACCLAVSEHNKQSAEVKIVSPQGEDMFYRKSVVCFQTEMKYCVISYVGITEQIHLTDEITKQKKELAAQRDSLTEQNKNITDSILYASRIQNAILPPDKFIKHVLPEHFILYKPRDIVSGDFYWVAQRGERIIIVAGDCTGHGVPGAIMSMLGIAILNEIVTAQIKANQIVEELREHVIRSLRQTGKKGEAFDGMDVSVCVIDNKTHKLEYTGAHNPLFIVREFSLVPYEFNPITVKHLGRSVLSSDGEMELLEIKADKMPIGLLQGTLKPFLYHEIDIQENDMLYVFSDGFIDQPDMDGKKLLRKRFKKILVDMYDKTMEEQKNILEEKFVAWKGEKMQLDDILVFGIKIVSKKDNKAQSESYNWADKVILIAEDEMISYMLLEEKLAKTRIKVLWAQNGKRAIELYKANLKIDMVLTDLAMPGMNGFEVIQQIREINADIPIIIQSAFFSRDEKEKGFKAGCDEFITKPINTQTLLATLNELLSVKMNK